MGSIWDVWGRFRLKNQTTWKLWSSCILSWMMHLHPTPWSCQSPMQPQPAFRAGQWFYYCLFETILPLAAQCLGCSCNHSSRSCLDTCLFIPDSGSCSEFTFLNSFILVCSAFRSLTRSKYSLPVSSMLMNSWSCMSLEIQSLSNDPDHTYFRLKRIK